LRRFIEIFTPGILTPYFGVNLKIEAILTIVMQGHNTALVLGIKIKADRDHPPNTTSQRNICGEKETEDPRKERPAVDKST